MRSFGGKAQKPDTRLTLLIYHGLRNYCLAEQEFLARHDVLRRATEWKAILMQFKSFNDVEAPR